MRICFMCDESAPTNDHIPPKCIFPEQKDVGVDYRKNLITVPACDNHNLKTSLDDEYLMGILAFHWRNNQAAYRQSITKIKRAFQHNQRYYDLYLNRFISPDTIIPDPANPQTLNRYSYAQNNPLRYTDPSGHSVDCGVGDPYCHAGTLDIKQRALDTATEIKRGSSTRYWRALTRQERLILSEAGWSEGDYNDFARGGNAVPADMWHDPLTYILAVTGGLKLGASLWKIGSTAAATEFADGDDDEVRAFDELRRVLRSSQINDGSITKGAFRPDKQGELSVFRGPGWLVKTLVGRSSQFGDVGGFASFSGEAIAESGLKVVYAPDPSLGLLGRLHYNVLYASDLMSKSEFDRLLQSLVTKVE